MLIDSYQREFHYLRLSITDVCNFSCNYCLPDGYECESSRLFLNLSEIQNLVTGFSELGVNKVRITGGEPGLRKDLGEIISVVKQTPGINKVALTTNGFNLENNIAHWVDAGLDQLNVSIDSLNANNFRLITGSNKHAKIMAGLDKAIELGIQVKVNSVLLRQFNLNEFETFLSWLKRKNVSLRFIELMQTGDNEEFFSQQQVRGEELKNKIETDGWLPVIKSKDAGPAQEYTHPDYQGGLGFILPYDKSFCDSCNRLRVSATGNLHKCLFAEEGQSLRHLLQTPEQNEQLKLWLLRELTGKSKSHSLHEQQTGATRHLAMLGG